MYRIKKVPNAILPGRYAMKKRLQIILQSMGLSILTE